MKERRFWKALASAFGLLALVQLPFSPARFGSIFFLALCAGCAGEYLMLKFAEQYRICAVLSVVGRVLFGLFVCSFVLIQCCIIQRGMHADPGADRAEYVLVLGALVNPDGRPSAALAARCNTAVDFLNEHPGTKAVLCGGQGWNEPCTEADSMFRYMMEKGISENRLLLEDQSANTIENIQNVRKLVEDAKIAVITSDYHVARTRVLMSLAGYEQCGIPAPTPHPGQWISVRCREYCSILGLMLSGRWRF